MGGFGSGKHGGRQCTDDMRPLDVRKMHREGLLKLGMAFSWRWSFDGDTTATINLRVTDADRVRLDYRSRTAHRNGGEWEPIQYTVSLEWTDCHLGGQRVWWLCPAAACGRRVAVLHGGRVFACRQCHQLAFRSQRERDDDRSTCRAEAVRRRLGWEPGILNGSGIKPKGMHWKTFDRLQAKHDEAVNASLAAMAARFGLLGDMAGECGRDRRPAG